MFFSSWEDETKLRSYLSKIVAFTNIQKEKQLTSAVLPGPLTGLDEHSLRQKCSIDGLQEVMTFLPALKCKYMFALAGLEFHERYSYLPLGMSQCLEAPRVKLKGRHPK